MFASKEWVKDLLTKVLKKNNEKINNSLTTIKSTTINVSTLISGATGTFEVYKIGRIVQLKWGIIDGINCTAWTSGGYVLAKLPDEFVPIIDISKAPLNGGYYAVIDGVLGIKTNGNIVISSAENITQLTDGSITYISAV